MGFVVVLVFGFFGGVGVEKGAEIVKEMKRNKKAPMGLFHIHARSSHTHIYQ